MSFFKKTFEIAYEYKVPRVIYIYISMKQQGNDENNRRVSRVWHTNFEKDYKICQVLNRSVTNTNDFYTLCQ